MTAPVALAHRATGRPAPRTSAAPQREERNATVDLLRGAAIVRVVLWHASGATWLTAFAAIPLMFFVTGFLLASALERRGYPTVLATRARRILLPLWLYGATVASAGALYSVLRGASLELYWRALLRGSTWLLPVTDPVSSGWHEGWLSSHLWYVRAYLWLLALAPLFAWLARRAARGATALFVVIVAVESTRRFSVPGVTTGAARVLLGDVATYGLFLMAGLAYRRSDSLPSRRVLLTGSAACAIGAALYAAVVGLPPGGVNASYLAVTLTGFSLLMAIGAVAGRLGKLAGRPAVARSTRFVSGRALTIYLWHPVAVVGARAAIDHRVAHPLPLVLLVTALLCGAAVIGAGRLEDIAAARRPLGVGVLGRVVAFCSAATIAMVAAVPVLTRPVIPRDRPDAATVQTPPLSPPSFREVLRNDAFDAPVSAQDPRRVRLVHGRMPTLVLQRVLDDWRRANPDVASVAVSVVADGRQWLGTSTRRGAVAIAPHQSYQTASLTKLFTAALVLRAVDEGRLDLDTPLPRVGGVRLPRGMVQVTPRQLLQHTSGIVDYRSLPALDRDPPLTPAKAVQRALLAPPLSPPGAEVHYTSTNYLYLGLILEEVTGMPYADLVAGMAAATAVPRIRVGPDLTPTWLGHAAAGVNASTPDLARWFDAVSTPGRFLSAPRVRQFLTIDRSNLGLGAWPLCPCWTTGSVHRSAAMGQFVGHGGLYHSSVGVTLSIHIEPSNEMNGRHVETLNTILTDALRRGAG